MKQNKNLSDMSNTIINNHLIQKNKYWLSQKASSQKAFDNLLKNHSTKTVRWVTYLFDYFIRKIILYICVINNHQNSRIIMATSIRKGWL